MNWLEQKYISLVSHRLQRFSRKSSGKYNFRCPICGDSEKSKYKARAWIYEIQGKSRFHCFNCSASMGVPKFIKMLDVNAHSQYVLEKMRDEKSPQQVDLENFVNKMKPPEFATSVLKGLKKVSQLRHDHTIKRYIDERKIPPAYHHKLYVCNNFFAFVNGLIPGKFSDESLKRDETRLLIPFLNREKKIHAFQGRALGKSTLKYITIVLDDMEHKIYGLDTVDLKSKTYVFEGPIDSMFIPNSISTAGGDLVSSLQGFDKSNLVIVYDNEPRATETIKKIDKARLLGYNVCIWPDNIEEKDVNDMVKAGMGAEYIKHVIDENTYRELSAKMALTAWSKA
jgi:transcription elongation factor Elf1